MSTSILITGATGTVGKAVLEYLPTDNSQLIYRASHHKQGLLPNERWLDFEQPDSFETALQLIDVVFLLRPPHLSDVTRYFKPFIAACQQFSVKQIVFLSVQGAETVSFIPHAKIEKLIRRSSIDYTFIRPSYFMENLTTTLKEDILRHDRLFLPAGKAPFLWVDVSDIGRAIATVLSQWKQHSNKAYSITGSELLTFHQVSLLLSARLGRTIRFKSPTLLRFYLTKRSEGLASGLILVMILLHFLPRFQKAPPISLDYIHLTQLKPNTLAHFIDQHIAEWI